MEPVYLFGGPTPPAKPTAEAVAAEKRLKRRRQFMLGGGAGLLGFGAYLVGRSVSSGEAETPNEFESSADPLVAQAVAMVEASTNQEMIQHLDSVAVGLSFDPDEPTLLFSLQVMTEHMLRAGEGEVDRGAVRALVKLIEPSGSHPRWRARLNALRQLER